jgi:hypothetical protein
LKGECCAHGHIGAVYMSLRNYTSAIKCYQLQLERAKELRDNTIEAEAFGNLGDYRIILIFKNVFKIIREHFENRYSKNEHGNL